MKKDKLNKSANTFKNVAKKDMKILKMTGHYTKFFYRHHKEHTNAVIDYWILSGDDLLINRAHKKLALKYLMANYRYWIKLIVLSAALLLGAGILMAQADSYATAVTYNTQITTMKQMYRATQHSQMLGVIGGASMALALFRITLFKWSHQPYKHIQHLVNTYIAKVQKAKVSKYEKYLTKYDKEMVEKYLIKHKK